MSQHFMYLYDALKGIPSTTSRVACCRRATSSLLLVSDIRPMLGLALDATALEVEKHYFNSFLFSLSSSTCI